jgi:transposase
VAHRGLARAEKKAHREHRELVFVDESGFYLLPAIVKTYAPRGDTPVLRVYQTRDHLSVMSGITLAGKLYTLVREEALTGCESVTFLKHLLHWVSDRLLIIWDGSPIHRGAEIKTFLAEGGAKHIHLEQLPPYAPDLNPDEGIWDLLKYVEMCNLCCLDLNHLHCELDLAIGRLRKKPHLIRTCFDEAGLAI